MHFHSSGKFVARMAQRGKNFRLVLLRLRRSDFRLFADMVCQFSSSSFPGVSVIVSANFSFVSLLSERRRRSGMVLGFDSALDFHVRPVPPHQLNLGPYFSQV